MSGDVTYAALERLTKMPDDAPNGGDRIAGQYHYDVEFSGGNIANVTLTDVVINGTTTQRAQTVVTGSSTYNVQTGDYVIIMNLLTPATSQVILPLAPTQSRTIIVKDGAGNALSFPITIDGNGKTIDGAASQVLGTSFAAIEIIFNTTTDSWEIIGSNKEFNAVQGPSSSTDNAITRWDGTTGEQVQDSTATLSDAGVITASGFVGSVTGAVNGVTLSTGAGLSNFLRGDGTYGAPTATAAFSALSGGTNTTAAMVVGTGASLGASGSGTIVATSATGNAGTATTLATPRDIGIAGTTGLTATGVNFDGSAAINPALTGTLIAVNGGTGQSTYTVGDLIQGAAANTFSKLAAVATGNALISGGVGVASSWGKIGLTTHVSGTLPVANGGTGVATATTAYGLQAAGTTATGAHQTLAAGLTTQILVGGGASALPAWTTATGTGAPVREGSPTFTGTPLSTTAAVGTNTTQIATTAFVQANKLIIGTPVATTSGTSIDFTGIPSGVKQITISFAGVSTNGTSNPMIQLGDSGGIETTGYVASSGVVLNGNITGTAGYTTGLGIASNAATQSLRGTYTLTLLNSSTNLWVGSGNMADTTNNGIIIGGGDKTLSAVLDRVRITTVGGTDTFDAGSINIAYS